MNTAVKSGVSTSEHASICETHCITSTKLNHLFQCIFSICKSSAHLVVQTSLKYKQYDVQHFGHKAVGGQVHNLHSSLDGCYGSLQKKPTVNTQIRN